MTGRNLDGAGVLVTVVLMLVVNAAYASPASDEAAAQAVEIKLYPMSRSEWSDEPFKTLVATEANSYCSNNLAACGMSNMVTFSSSDIGLLDLEDDSKSLKMGVYSWYPAFSNSPNSSTQYVLPSSAVKEILKNARDTVKENVDVYMTYIGTDYYGIPPDSTANAALVPIAILVVVITGIVVIILVKWQQRKERDDRKAARLMEKKGGDYGTSQSQPQYNILDATNSTVLTTNTPRHGSGNNKVSPDNYATNHSQKESVEAKSGAIRSHTYSSPNYYDDSEMDKKNGALPPLDERDQMTEEEKQEKRRRKKEKKREKRRLREQREMNAYDNEGLDSSNPTESESKTYSVGLTYNV